MVLGTRLLINIIDYFLSRNNWAKILKLAVEMALPLQTVDYTLDWQKKLPTAVTGLTFG